MTPITVTVFCQSNGGSSSGVGLSTRSVNLASVPGSPARAAVGDQAAVAAVPSPNASLFNNGVGQIGVNFQNPSDMLVAGFELGKKYTVTITEIE